MALCDQFFVNCFFSTPVPDFMQLKPHLFYNWRLKQRIKYPFNNYCFVSVEFCDAEKYD